jgi:hypothetical protein
MTPYVDATTVVDEPNVTDTDLAATAGKAFPFQSIIQGCIPTQPMACMPTPR